MSTKYIELLSEKHQTPIPYLNALWGVAVKIANSKCEKEKKYGAATRIFKNLINKKIIKEKT